MRRLMVSVLLLCVPVLAQTAGPRPHVEELLSSPSLLDQAWGVYFAGLLHEDSLNSVLQQRLSEAQSYSGSEFGSEEHAYVFALFDALIQSGQTVPAEALMPFAEQWPDEVIILLCRTEGNEDEWLQLRAAKLNDAQWLAVNNFLFRLRSSRFFVLTLNELHITHRFLVVNSSLGFGNAMCRGSHGEELWQLPKGFPPIGFYRLVSAAFEGSVLVVPGPRNAYYRRAVIPTVRQGGSDLSGSGGVGEQQQERKEYLAVLTGSTLAQMDQVFSPSTSIQWKDEDDFHARVQAALSSQVWDIQNFASVAKQAGVTGLEGSKLTIVPEVEDQRINVEKQAFVVPPVAVSLLP